MVESRRGALLIALAAVLFGFLGALVKHLSGDMSNAMIVFFRNAGGLLALLPFLRGQESLRTQNFWGHFGRSLAGVGSMYLSFYAIGHMRLADAFVLVYSAPLFMPFLGRWWLGEPIPRHAGVALLLGFGGVLLLLKPGWGVFQPVAVLALAAGLLSAVAQVGIRQLTRTDPPVRIVFYFGLIATGLTAPPLVGSWETPSLGTWVVLGGLGFLSTAAQLIMTEGYRLASPGDVGSLMYAAVAVAGLADWIFWNRLPDLLSFAGIGLIIAAGIWIVRSTRPVPLSGRRVATP
ncbi:MAG: EamA family transporter [Elusimicrobia bacterium]|nr:EamA family transporter [Elusimicrobiota bacterium]